MLAPNHKVKWIINDQDGPITYYGVVSAVKRNRITVQVPGIGVITADVTDGQFEPVQELGANPQMLREQEPEIKPVIAKPLPVGGMRMSDQVRAQILIAKQHNQEQDTVVEWAVTTLKMPRAQARVYVKGNWARVKVN